MISNIKQDNNPDIPKTLHEIIINKPWFDQVINYQEYLAKRRFLSSYTVRNYIADLTTFFKFLDTISMNSLHQLDKNHIRAYMRWLSMSDVSRKSISRKLSSLKSFFSYLEDNKEVFHNPAEMVNPPKQVKKLPRIENSEDISKMMYVNSFPSKTILRDRAILEVLYASGMRVSEISNIMIENIQLHVHGQHLPQEEDQNLDRYF